MIDVKGQFVCFEVLATAAGAGAGAGGGDNMAQYLYLLVVLCSLV